MAQRDPLAGSELVTKSSPWSVEETVTRFTALLTARGLAIFAEIDHGGEARKIGLELRGTKVLIFGSPAVGTPVMVAVPLVALDLPLKVLVWSESDAARYELSNDLASRLAGNDALTDALLAT